jgi:hypothetical protein
MKIKGNERGVRRVLALLTIINLHILPLFLQQHEGNGDGDGKIDRQRCKNKKHK